MKVLELFAGTRSIGKAFASREHQVYSVEWDKSFDGISLYADIGTLTAKDCYDLVGGGVGTVVAVTESAPQLQGRSDVSAVLTPGMTSKTCNGRLIKEPGEPAFAVTAAIPNGVALDVPEGLRIRYLTERECMRLMGQSDDAIDRMFAVEPSKSARYRAAGNSIVVDVLEAIFRGIYIDETFDPPQPRQKSLEDWL